VNVDRTKGRTDRLTQNNVAQTDVDFAQLERPDRSQLWLNFQNGVNYQVAVQTPQYKMDTLQDLKNTAGSGA